MKFSVLIYFFYCFPIYIFIYLFHAAKFMHNINMIHRSFSPTTLFPCLAGCLTFSLPCPACFHALPISSAFCLFPFPAYFLSLPYFLASPVAFPFPCLPCLFPCPAYCLSLFPCPAYFCALPFSLPCLLPCPTYRSTFLYECTLHGYIASPLY